MPSQPAACQWSVRAESSRSPPLIFWDGTGLCLFAKRLEDGIFRWPKIDGVKPNMRGIDSLISTSTTLADFSD
jgi:transposase